MENEREATSGLFSLRQFALVISCNNNMASNFCQHEST